MNTYLCLFLFLFCVGSFGYVMRSGMVSKVVALAIFSSSTLMMGIDVANRSGSTDTSVFSFFVILLLGIQIVVGMSIAIMADKKIKEGKES